MLLVLVGIQARARFGYSMTLRALQQRLEEDEGVDAKTLYVTDLDQYVVGWPARKDSQQGPHTANLELTWRGLTGTYGLVLSYDPGEDGGAIMGLQSRGYVEPPPTKNPEGAIPAEQAARMGQNLPPGAPGSEPAGAPAAGGPTEPAAAPSEAPATDQPADDAAAPSAEPADAQPAPAEESSAGTQ